MNCHVSQVCIAKIPLARRGCGLYTRVCIYAGKADMATYIPRVYTSWPRSICEVFPDYTTHIRGGYFGVTRGGGRSRLSYLFGVTRGGSRISAFQLHVHP